MSGDMILKRASRFLRLAKVWLFGGIYELSQDEVLENITFRRPTTILLRRGRNTKSRNVYFKKGSYLDYCVICEQVNDMPTISFGGGYMKEGKGPQAG